MKNLFKSLLALALFATGCAKDTNIDPTNQGGALNGTAPSFTSAQSVEVTQATATKIAVTDGENLSFKWEVDDRVTLYKIAINVGGNINQAANTKVAVYKVSDISESGVATFDYVPDSTPDTETFPESGMEYVACYGVAPANLHIRSYSYNNTVYNGESDLSYLKTGMKMQSNSFLLDSNTAPEISFTHQVAYQKFKFTLPTVVSGYTATQLEALKTDEAGEATPLYIVYANLDAEDAAIGGYRSVQIAWNYFNETDNTLELHVPMMPKTNYEKLQISFTGNYSGTSLVDLYFTKLLTLDGGGKHSYVAGTRYGMVTVNGDGYSSTVNPVVPDGPAQISTTEDLVNFAARVNEGEYDLDAILMDNIVFPEGATESNMSIILEELNTQKTSTGEDVVQKPAYTGTFDGANYAIVNLYISKAMGGYDYDSGKKNNGSLALFGNVGAGAVIKDLTIRNARLECTDATFLRPSNSGVIAGSLTNATVVNCKVENSSIIGGARTGGVVGYSWSTAYIINCAIENSTVESKNTKVGAITGEYGGKLVGCYNNATSVKCATVSSEYNIGGVIGLANLNADVYGCYSNGTMSPAYVSSKNYGGVGGNINANATFLNNYYSSEIAFDTKVGETLVIDDIAAANADLMQGVNAYNATGEATTKATKYVMLSADGTPSFGDLIQ